MIDQAVVEELSVEDTLDAVETWAAEQTQRQIAIFLAAAHFADLHHPDRRRADAGGRGLPGTERAKPLGGAGTPAVREFAAAAFGARIGATTYAAKMLMADALDVRHRLPLLWARVGTGQVPVRAARFVAAQTRGLSRDAAGVVDAEVAETADGRLCWSRFAALVEAKIVAADPEAAADRERQAATGEFAKVSRGTEHGQKTLYVRSAAAAMVRIDATIAYLADALAVLGDHHDEDTRRAQAVLIMANPAQALQLLAAFAHHRRSSTTGAGDDLPGNDLPGNDLPVDDQPGDDQAVGESDGEVAGTATKRFLEPFRPGGEPGLSPRPGYRVGFDPRDLLPPITCYLHLSADTVIDGGGGVARWEGEGPISSHYLTEYLGPAAHLILKPVIDLAHMAPVDAYEIPDRHREAVHLTSPADVFPFASATTTRDGRRGRHLDHTRPYIPPDHGGPPGQTAVTNLGPMTGYHHRVKTHGGWQLKQPFSGIFVWRDPHGRTYLVDHTGTRRLGKTEPADMNAPDITLEVYPPPDDVIIEHRAAHAA